MAVFQESNIALSRGDLFHRNILYLMNLFCSTFLFLMIGTKAEKFLFIPLSVLLEHCLYRRRKMARKTIRVGLCDEVMKFIDL